MRTHPTIPGVVLPEITWSQYNHPMREFVGEVFVQSLAHFGYPFTASDAVETESTLEELLELAGFEMNVVCSYRGADLPKKPNVPSMHLMLMKIGDSLLSCDKRESKLYMETVSEDEQEGLGILAQLRKVAPPITSTPDGKISVHFWSLNADDQPAMRLRRIQAANWNDVGLNYTESARSQIESLMNVRPPLDSGSLVLLHGTPGTGKSYTIRALANMWQSWCNIHYIVDPEKFFGIADYMMTVLLEHPEAHFDGEADFILQGSDRWNLLIVEDSDEFLRADAKLRTGQALSRLLNLADGMIGQGIPVILLLTTNEPVGALHPAVARPGRAMANIEFGPLTLDEARRWVNRHGGDSLPDVPESELTLARLFDHLKESRQITHRRKVTGGTYL